MFSATISRKFWIAADWIVTDATRGVRFSSRYNRGRCAGSTVTNAPLIVAPFELGDDGVILITAIGREGDDDATVLWQRRGAGTLPDPSGFGAQGAAATPPAGIAIGPDETIVIAEVMYDYEPLTLRVFSPERITKVSYFRPRLGSLQQIDP